MDSLIGESLSFYCNCVSVLRSDVDFVLAADLAVVLRLYSAVALYGFALAAVGSLVEEVAGWSVSAFGWKRQVA